MSAPPGVMSDQSSRRNQERRGPAGASTEDLVRDARRILDACGVVMSPSRVSRLVRSYEQEVRAKGVPFALFLLNSVHLSAARRVELLADPEMRRAVAYADPTGEQAVRNVLRDGRGRRSSG